ncbi:hypothetical protein WN55_02431, partial [Dufourea novaeangliae]
LWFQHDGYPAHYARISREVLDRNFPGRWIARGGTIQWPARSPDFNQLDFCLWGALKDKMYTNIPTAVDMCQRIVIEYGNINPEILNNVQHSLRNRLQTC